MTFIFKYHKFTSSCTDISKSNHVNHVSCCAGKMVRQQCAACEPGSPTDVKIRNGAGDSEAQAAASSSPGNLYTLHMVMADKHPTCLPYPAASTSKDQISSWLLSVVLW